MNDEENVVIKKCHYCNNCKQCKNSILSDPSSNRKVFGHLINISNIGLLEILRLMNLTENLRLDQVEIQNLECRAPQRYQGEPLSCSCVNRAQLKIQILLMQ